jgi:aspartyl protease family protein
MLSSLDTWDKGQFWYLLGFLLIVAMAAIPRIRTIGFGRAAKMALIWVLIFGGLIVFVVQWPQIRSALDPAAPVSRGNEVRVQARQDGHFYVRAQVNGQSVLFLIDTGATDIMLTRETAERVGISPETLRYDRIAMTANGTARVAGARIGTLEVGNIGMHDVPVSVSEGGLDTNLLGMRFLNRLGGWRVERGTLIMAASSSDA